MELSLCPRVPQRWESPPPGQSRRSSLATLPLLWGMEGAIEQRELCVISWRSSDHEPLMSSLCAQISFRESQSRSWRETIEMFQHPIYPTAVALDPFFFFFSLATVSQPEPNQSQPGCPAGGIDELCRSGPASTVPFSPALTRSFVSLSFADPSVFFLATSSSDLDSDSPIPAQRPTTADPRNPHRAARGPIHFLDFHRIPNLSADAQQASAPPLQAQGSLSNRKPVLAAKTLPACHQSSDDSLRLASLRG